VAQKALDAQKLLIQGLEKNVTDLQKQLDDALRQLGDLRIAAQWSLQQAQQALSDFQQASGVLLGILSQITDWSIGGLVAVHEAHFNGALNLVSGGRVSLSVDLQIQGQEKQYSFDFNFYGLDESAKNLAGMIMHDWVISAVPQG
jgi:hypothetical protein